MSLFLASNLILERGEKVLIRESNFSIRRGKVTVILGPNGVGKSTLLLALAGLHRIAGGSLLLGDQSLQDFSHQQLAEKITWQGALPPSEFGLKVFDRLGLAMRDTPDSGHLYRDTCQILDIEHLQERALGELSSGERQRVELAAALLRDTDILLLDEPVSHLDLKHQVSFLSMMQRLTKEKKSILVVLHDIQQAVTIADDVLMIFDDGRVEHGPADSVMSAERFSELFDTEIKETREGSTRLMLPSYFLTEPEER
ncbi:MAG: ABC transporter ATP-binding protein [Mariprofundaceae bacterium]